ncbi:hypothetical protein [Ketogulonicigenium robustum]|nr:hypothetical protein [Ketogulonicigenium robustum]
MQPVRAITTAASRDAPPRTADDRPPLVASIAASALINLLALTGPLYMLNVYDKVFAAASLATLLALSLMALCGYGALLRAEDLRLRILAQSPATGSAAARLLSRPNAAQLLDLPFIPLFLAVLCAIHPLLALTAVVLGSGAFAIARYQPLDALGRGRIAALLRNLHQAGQSVIIGVGAWLALEGAISAGALFAAALLCGKLYAPLEAAASLTVPPPRAAPPPAGVFSGDKLACQGLRLPPLTTPVTFALNAGDALAVVGASGSGKSRLLTYLAQRGAGTCFPAPAAGQPPLGYVPQALIDPAQGFTGGTARLFAIKQVFAGPARSILLDMPENDLDSHGIDRLCTLIATARAAGSTLIIATHQPRIIAACTQVLVIEAQTQWRAAS